jgi:WD repeat-containing protein 19
MCAVNTPSVQCAALELPQLWHSRERKKTPYLGKHTKKCVGAAWGRDNQLALVGLDRLVGALRAVCGVW